MTARSGQAAPGVSKIQVRHLETFLAIVGAGTLTAAADRLYKTQGAISHDLKALEDILGVTVIDRSGQRIELTPAGAALLPHAQELIARIHAAEGAMQRIRHGDRTIVRIGAVPSLAQQAVPYVAGFRREQHDFLFKLVTGDARGLGDALFAGELDLVLAETDPRDGIKSSALDSEEFRVVLSERDPLAASPRLSIAQLAERDFVGLGRDVATPAVTQRFFSSVDRYPDPAVEVTEFWLMIELIRAGGSFCLLPVSAVERADGVVAVPPDPPLERQVAISYSTRRILPRGVVAFHDYLLGRWTR
ncbi:MAG: LysR family transcriptional regulator [Thermoleophilaceae bacterium]